MCMKIRMVFTVWKGLEWRQSFEQCQSHKFELLVFINWCDNYKNVIAKYSGLKFMYDLNFQRNNSHPWFEKFKQLFLVLKICQFPMSKHSFNQHSVKGMIHWEIFFSEDFMKCSFRVILWNIRYFHGTLLLWYPTFKKFKNTKAYLNETMFENQATKLHVLTYF